MGIKLLKLLEDMIKGLVYYEKDSAKGQSNKIK